MPIYNSGVERKGLKYMRVQPISLNGGRYLLNLNNSDNKIQVNNGSLNITDLNLLNSVYPVMFTSASIQNATKLRQLFAHNLICMYSGVTMIDPKSVARLVRSGIFSKPASESVKVFKQYENSIFGMEKRLIELLEQRSLISPNKNIQELMQELEPVYKRRLRRRQAPVFHLLNIESQRLPKKYKIKYNQLMDITEKKLNERPVLIPFSSTEFKYKLSKIRETLLNTNDLKAKKVINKMIKESKKLANSTNANTIENQRKVIGMLDWILKKSVLKDNEELKSLIDNSKSRLFNEKTIIPFSRKAFIYDLAKLLDGLPSQRIQERMLLLAQHLPTSSESFSAFFMKLAAEPPEKIGFRILWPAVASIEHIHPRSCGGADLMSNFGVATTKINSERKSIDFVSWIKLHPDVPQHCQEYLDRMIELYKQGVFAKYNISPKYLKDFANAIEKESRSIVKLKCDY